MIGSTLKDMRVSTYTADTANTSKTSNTHTEGQPESQLNPKKKVFETIQPGFRTLDTLEACWINPENSKPHLIKTDKGVCRAGRFANATLS